MLAAVLRTTLADQDNATLWRTYIMLTELESVFRALRTDLNLRPVFHRVDRRVEGHLIISVLADHFVHTLRLQLKAHGINDTGTRCVRRWPRSAGSPSPCSAVMAGPCMCARPRAPSRGIKRWAPSSSPTPIPVAPIACFSEPAANAGSTANSQLQKRSAIRVGNLL